MDEMTFTLVPSSGPVSLRQIAGKVSARAGASIRLTVLLASQNAGEDMIFETLEMNSKRLPDWVKAIKIILKIAISDSDDD